MDKKIAWHAKETHREPKGHGWYWAIGILFIGGAIASVVAHNALLAVLLVLGGFAVMLAGSLPAQAHHVEINERGIKLNAQVVPWSAIHRFAIHEDEPLSLTLETATLLGTVTVPLSDADFREIRTELKNRDIEEADSLDTVVSSITRALGL